MTIRWGILGCGDVAEHKSGPALMHAKGSEVVAVMRRDAVKAKDFARRHHVPRWYSDADALINDSEVDAVYIATLPDTHADYTLRVAKAGKHVLVEKPMARTVAECETMISACEKAGVSLHVAYYRRFYAKFVAAKKMIDDGHIGKIVNLTLQMAKPSETQSVTDVPWRLKPELSGGGLFVDTGSHRIDIILYLAGDMVDIRGFSANLTNVSAAEDSIAFAFRMADSGALGTAMCQFSVSPMRRDRLEIVGTEGILLFDSFDDDAFTLMRRDRTIETFRYPNPDPVHLPFVEALIRVYHGEPIAHVTGQEGLRTNRVIEDVLRG